MIIGIDGNEANVDRKVGISEYAFQLLVRFSKNPEHDFRIYLKSPPNDQMPNQGNKWHYRLVYPKKFWTQFGLPIDLYTHKPKPSVFFSPTHYAPRFSPVPTVVSIMDLSFLYFPELFRKEDLYQLVNWTRYSVKKAAAVITISESSKNDIIKEYKIPAEKIHVVYLGIKESAETKTQKMEELSKKYGVKNRFVLFVGTLQPRKNITKLIESLSLIKDKNVDLVVIGKKGWLYEDILAAPEKYGVSDRVKFLDFVPDEDLTSFYKHAECYVLPSLYEGFGLPVLEAMKYGCPVLTSNISSLPEAGGDAALYFDPKNAEDIAKSIDKVLKDKNLRSDMIKKGYAQVKKFSWDKSAEEVLSVLEEVGRK